MVLAGDMAPTRRAMKLKRRVVYVWRRPYDRTINIHSYYNDQPVDYLFWQGMALRLLGEQQTAQQLF